MTSAEVLQSRFRAFDPTFSFFFLSKPSNVCQSRHSRESCTFFYFPRVQRRDGLFPGGIGDCAEAFAVSFPSCFFVLARPGNLSDLIVAYARTLLNIKAFSLTPTQLPVLGDSGEIFVQNDGLEKLKEKDKNITLFDGVWSATECLH